MRDVESAQPKQSTARNMVIWPVSVWKIKTLIWLCHNHCPHQKKKRYSLVPPIWWCHSLFGGKIYRFISCMESQHCFACNTNKLFHSWTYLTLHARSKTILSQDDSYQVSHDYRLICLVDAGEHSGNLEGWNLDFIPSILSFLPSIHLRITLLKS